MDNNIKNGVVGQEKNRAVPGGEGGNDIVWYTVENFLFQRASRENVIGLILALTRLNKCFHHSFSVVYTSVFAGIATRCSPLGERLSTIFLAWWCRNMGRSLERRDHIKPEQLFLKVWGWAAALENRSITGKYLIHAIFTYGESGGAPLSFDPGSPIEPSDYVAQ